MAGKKEIRQEFNLLMASIIECVQTAVEVEVSPKRRLDWHWQPGTGQDSGWKVIHPDGSYSERPIGKDTAEAIAHYREIRVQFEKLNQSLKVLKTK